MTRWSQVQWWWIWSREWSWLPELEGSNTNHPLQLLSIFWWFDHDYDGGGDNDWWSGRQCWLRAKRRVEEEGGSQEEEEQVNEAASRGARRSSTTSRNHWVSLALKVWWCQSWGFYQQIMYDFVTQFVTLLQSWPKLNQKVTLTSELNRRSRIDATGVGCWHVWLLLTEETDLNLGDAVALEDASERWPGSLLHVCEGSYIREWVILFTGPPVRSTRGMYPPPMWVLTKVQNLS